MATFQLRRYRVRPGAMDEWLTEWAEKIRPLRERHGFAVVGAWRGRDEDDFVWLIRHDGPSSWEEAERSYYESDERRNLDPDPARHLEAVDTLLLSEVPA